ncbi:MAG: T9SS type A sorting domain-containing protein, partial [Ignavibacteriaceae bacterium]
GFVNLKVFNAIGEEVAVLVNGFQKTGNHQLIFNANNLPSGIYIYQLTTGNYIESKKMLLLK